MSWLRVVDPDDPDLFNFTDVGNAERLLSRHGSQLRHTPGNGWRVWTGQRWERDEAAATRMVIETHRAIYDAAAHESDKERRTGLSAWAVKSEDARRVANTMTLARNLEPIACRDEQFDADPWLFNATNCTIDLRTAEQWPHRPADLITRLAPVDYEPAAPAPLWLAFLDRVTGGSAALAAYLARMVGLALVGKVLEHVLFFLFGSGANGKSTFLTALLNVLGDYSMQGPSDLLISRRDDTHPTALADLAGRRLVACIEPSADRRLAEEIVKWTTGGDAIRARRMHRDYFEFQPSHTTFLAANHKPGVRGTDDGIWRRIRLVPFIVSIPREEQDKHLGEKLAKEAPGILAWAVRGCLDWQRQGLADPPEVQRATNAYRAEMDVLGGFISDRCVLQEDAQAAARDLYVAYADWCREAGEHAVSQSGFGARLQERGFQSGRTKSGRYWRGVGLLGREQTGEMELDG